MKKRNPIYFLGLITMLFVSSCGKNDNSSTHSDTSELITSENTSDSSSLKDTSTTTSETPITGTPDSVSLFYHRDDNGYSDYGIWYWTDKVAGNLLPFETYDDNFAVINIPSTMYEGENGFYLIVRKKSTWDGQSPDFYLDFSQYTLNSDLTMDVYIISTETLDVEAYSTPKEALGNRIVSATLTSFSTIKATGTAPANQWSLYLNDEKIDEQAGSDSNEVIFNLSTDVDLTDKYTIKAVFPDAMDKIRSKVVSAAPLFNTSEFDSRYAYDEDDLGAVYSLESTVFKLWAPTSYEVTLFLYKVGYTSKETGNILHDVPQKRIPMEYAGQGVYRAEVAGDLDRMYYTYLVNNSNGKNEVIDPYAKSAGPNGRRGQILDFAKYEPENFDNTTFSDIASPNDLIVYEMHVQDLTSDSSWNGDEANRGHFLGLIESGTTYSMDQTTVTTGFDHIKELGINAVQIMPFYDQSNDELNPAYNWGYNPANYNVLEGGYSSNPKLGEVRVQEFKQVVAAYANAGIRIIMDVVYNHVASFSSSQFQKIVPDYYFRRNADGTLKNESGVGNDIKTEATMMSKYIVDSVKFWASEYHIMGFRFDLMSLIDDATLQKVDAALKAINPDIVVWGEPWSGGGYMGPAKVYSAALKDTSVAAFNDVGRNAIKGDNNLNGNGSQYGWLQKEPAHNQSNVSYLNRVKGMLAGYMGDYYEATNYTDPSKTVNYVDCHDNFTIFDHLLATMGNNPDVSARASLVANSLVLTSFGTPFFQGGDEIMRSKEYDPTTEIGAIFLSTHGGESVKIGDKYYSGNSYNLESTVNSYKWADKIKYASYFESYKNLIALRRNNPAYKMYDSDDISAHFGYWNNVQDLSYSAIASYNTKAAESSGAIYSFYTGMLYGSSTANTNINTKQTISWGAGDCIVLFDSTGELTGQTLSSSISLSSLQTVIVQRLS
jgi:pullulanase